MPLSSYSRQFFITLWSFLLAALAVLLKYRWFEAAAAFSFRIILMDFELNWFFLAFFHSIVLFLFCLLFTGILWYEEALSKLNCGMGTHIHYPYTYKSLEWYLRAKNILLFHWINVFLVFPSFSCIPLIHSSTHRFNFVKWLFKNKNKKKKTTKITTALYECLESWIVFSAYQLANWIFSEVLLSKRHWQIQSIKKNKFW